MASDSDPAAAQQHWFETMGAQRTLFGMSDCPGQFRQDPMMALINQAHRAKTGQDSVGLDYLTVPF